MFRCRPKYVQNLSCGKLIVMEGLWQLLGLSANENEKELEGEVDAKQTMIGWLDQVNCAVQEVRQPACGSASVGKDSRKNDRSCIT